MSCEEKMNRGANNAIFAFHIKNEQGVVWSEWDGKHWMLKWDNGPWRIYLGEEETAEDALESWWRAGKASAITVFTGLPDGMVELIKEWQEGWREAKGIA